MRITLSDALKEVEGNKFFKVLEREGLTKISYRFNSPKVFDTPLKRELRGITFDSETGKVLSRPYHKFFNLNEAEESREERLRGREFIFREKLDGTMLHPVLIDGEVKLLTQKGFENPQTEKGKELLKRSEKLYRHTKELLKRGLTPIFELISPQFQLVIPYEREELFLTEVRDNETGKYLLEELEEELTEAGFKLPPKRVATLEEVEREVKEREFVEGFVLKDFSVKGPFPLFVKVKSPWYHERHQIFTYLHQVPLHKLFNLYLTGKADELFSKITNREVKGRRERELSKLVELYLTLVDSVSKYRDLPFERAKRKVLNELKRFSKDFSSLEIEEEYLKEALRIAKKGGKFDRFLGNKLYILLKSGKIALREGR
ncbi:T4 RnlA family RNA ligase [Thermovibrio sp.]